MYCYIRSDQALLSPSPKELHTSHEYSNNAFELSKNEYFYILLSRK